MTEHSGDDRDTEDSIAIVGMAGRLPGAPDLDRFWANIRGGVESITFSTVDELLAAGVDPQVARHPDFVPAHGLIEGTDQFDAGYFGYTPLEAELIDPQQRLFLEVAHTALEHAALDPSAFSGRVGVFGGTAISTYFLQNILPRRDLIETVGTHQININNDKDYLATRVAYKLGLTGPAHTVQTSCSTSLVAVHTACQSLLTYQCDAAVAGGSRVSAQRRTGYLHHHGSVASPDGHTRTYDADAQGTVGGDGVGAVVLKRLADAVADGDTIHAVILASAINNDGDRKVGFTAPSVAGQAAAITDALELAGVDPETIGYVEGHGTATPLGDPVEVAALTRAYRRFTDRSQYCVLGSVKPNIGHLDAAAGVAGLIKAVLTLRNAEFPPSVNFTAPNPAIDFENSPFVVNTELRAWEAGPGPRRAAVSSFGLGGTNAHIILQEAPKAAPKPAPTPQQDAGRPGPELIVVSARSREALAQASADLAEALRADPAPTLADTAFTLRAGRRTHPWRRIVVAESAEQAAAALGDRERSLVEAVRQESTDGRVYFMFPGGGTAFREMGRGLYQDHPVYRSAVDRCAALLGPDLGLDIRQALFPDPAVPGAVEAAEELLTRGAVNLPAIVVTEYALAELLISLGVRPNAMIGHSLGEYTAACLSGVLTLADAMKLVAVRGRLFDTLAPGGMVAVPMTPADLAVRLPAGLSLAAVNAPDSCVVSGPRAEVDAFADRLEAGGVQVSRLRAPGAAHSSMIDAILDEFGRAAAEVEFAAPQIPYLSNVTGGWVDAELVKDPGYWTRHLRGTVRFADGLAGLADSGPGVFLEVGPGRGLSTLARQQGGAPRPALTVLRRADEPGSDTGALLGAIGQTWANGVDIARTAPSGGGRRIPLPTYPFERRSYWVEPGAPAAAVGRSQPSGRDFTDRANWFDVPGWRLSPLTGAQPVPAPDQNWLVFADGGGLSRAVSERLSGAGVRTVVEVVRGAAFAVAEGGPNGPRYTVDPTRNTDYEELVADLARRELLPRHVLHLWTAGADRSPDPSAAERITRFEQAQPDGFYSLLFLAQALESGRANQSVDLTVAGVGLHSVTGGEALDFAAASVLGICRVLPQENPTIACRVVDLGSGAGPAAAARWLLREHLDGRGAPASAYRAGRRWLPEFEAVTVPEPAAAPFRHGGSYLVTGGADELVQPYADHLAREYAAHLSFLERPSFPAEPDWDAWLDRRPAHDPVSARIRRIRELRVAGARVEVVRADAASRGDLARALDEVLGSAGALHGVFHTAGLAEERVYNLVPDTTMSVCQEHFRRRVHSTVALTAALADRELDFCVVQGTVSAQLGGLGRSAGVAAMAACRLVVELARRASAEAGNPTRWFVTDWDDGEFRVAAGADTEIGPPFTAEQMASSMARVLALPEAADLVVLPDDIGPRVAYWLRREGFAADSQSGGSRSLHPRPALVTPYVAPRSGIEQELADIWRLLLGIEAVGVDDDFFHLGGHSLLGTQLVAKLRTAFDIDFPLRNLFEGPTVAGMAQRVVQIRATRTDSDDLEALLAQLELLGDDFDIDHKENQA